MEVSLANLGTEPLASITGTAQPAAAPVAQMVAQPAAAPVAQPAAAPVAQPAAAPVAQPAAAPVAQMVAQPAAAPVAQMVAQPAAAPVAQMVAQPAAAPVAQPAAAPVAQMVAQPAAAPIRQATVEVMPVPPAPPASTPAALTLAPLPATQATTALGKPSIFAGASDFEGEWGVSDVQRPTLNLCQGLSEFMDIDRGIVPGQFVLSKEVLLRQPLRIVVLLAAKRFQQDVKYGEEAAMFATVEEVKAAGGTVIFSEQAKLQGRFYHPLASFLLAVAGDGVGDQDREHFPHTAPDESIWALAKFTVARTAYTSFAVPVATTRQRFLQQGAHHGLFQLTSRTETNKKNTWSKPIPQFMGVMGPPFVDFFGSLVPHA